MGMDFPVSSSIRTIWIRLFGWANRTRKSISLESLAPQLATGTRVYHLLCIIKDPERNNRFLDLLLQDASGHPTRSPVVFLPGITPFPSSSCYQNAMNNTGSQGQAPGPATGILLFYSRQKKPVQQKNLRPVPEYVPLCLVLRQLLTVTSTHVTLRS
jgi:hypothetical protein